MAWNPEYTEEFNSLMEKWDRKYMRNQKNRLLQEVWLPEVKAKQIFINEKYKALLTELKQKYGMI